MYVKSKDDSVVGDWREDVSNKRARLRFIRINGYNKSLLSMVGL